MDNKDAFYRNLVETGQNDKIIIAAERAGLVLARLHPV